MRYNRIPKQRKFGLDEANEYPSQTQFRAAFKTEVMLQMLCGVKTPAFRNLNLERFVSGRLGNITVRQSKASSGEIILTNTVNSARMGSVARTEMMGRLV